MHKTAFNKRQPLVFHHFGNHGYSLFACLGREVVCSVLSVATLTYASAESVSTHPVTADSVATRTDRELMLDEVSVTGSRAPLTQSQAARMVTVLDRADIQQAPVQSVNDLLKYAVGVDVRQRGAIGAQTDISVRGGTSEQIIVLLNGINICDPQTGHNVMDLPVDLSEIVRIEVLEGPAGRIYGSSSLVGAINIVTVSEKTGRGTADRASEAKRIDGHVEGGSYGYMNVGARYALNARCPSAGATFNSSLSANYTRSDGYSRAKSGSLNTDFSGSKVFYQGQYADDGVRVNWYAGLADKGWGSSTFYASPKWQADDQYEHTTKIVTALQAETRRGSVRFRPAIYWNQHRDRYEGYRGQPDVMKYNYNRCNVYGVNLNSYFDWMAGRTALGAELRNEDLQSGNLGEPLARPHSISGTGRDYTSGINRTNISAYLEHNLLLRHFTLSAGLVAVKNTWADMNPTVYPGVDASVRIGKEWKVQASYNTSLRMPSFTEMYYKLQGYQADPHLKPEEMQAVQAGVTFSPAGATFSATGWYHHGRNMIDWIMDTRLGQEATWQSVNHTRLNSIGMELSARLNMLQLLPRQHVLRSMNVSYSYITQSKELEDGIVSQYALEYLRHKLVANAQLQLISRLRLSIDLRWQDRVGQYTDFQNEVHDYAPFCLVDARLAWQEHAYKLYLQANNLFDQSYVDYGHVPQPGIWLVAGVSVSF